MKQWVINRDNQNSFRTYGAIYRADGSRFSDYLELPWKDDAPNISCIPGNVHYLADFRWSQEHQGPRFWYRNVRGRSACEIHSANIPAQLRGCGAPGYGRERLMQIEGFAPADGVANSREALQDFMSENGLGDFLTLTTEDLVNTFLATHPELATIEIQLNDLPTVSV